MSDDRKITSIAGGRKGKGVPTVEETALDARLKAIGEANLAAYQETLAAYPQVMKALTNKALEGDVEAIEVFLDVTIGWSRVRGLD